MISYEGSASSKRSSGNGGANLIGVEEECSPGKVAAAIVSSSAPQKVDSIEDRQMCNEGFQHQKNGNAKNNPKGDGSSRPQQTFYDIVYTVFLHWQREQDRKWLKKMEKLDEECRQIRNRTKKGDEAASSNRLRILVQEIDEFILECKSLSRSKYLKIYEFLGPLEETLGYLKVRQWRTDFKWHVSTQKDWRTPFMLIVHDHRSQIPELSASKRRKAIKRKNTTSRIDV